MQRTKEDIVALIQKGERLHAECKEAFGALPDALWESYSAFANPGTFLISKEDAIAGGNSEPRNEKIFNIFALVKIGERSGAGLSGLSDLYGQWEKYGFPPPVIDEKYDPDRTVIRVAVEVGSGEGSVESSEEGGQEVDKGCTTAAQQLHKNCTRTAQESLADIHIVWLE